MTSARTRTAVINHVAARQLHRKFTEKDWSSYEDRLGFYFEANEIVDDAIGKHRTILLISVGKQIYTLLCSFTSPRGQADLSLGELYILLQSHSQPKPNKILQRHKFYSTYRKTDQLIGDFVAELEKMARRCHAIYHHSEKTFRNTRETLHVRRSKTPKTDLGPTSDST